MKSKVGTVYFGFFFVKRKEASSICQIFIQNIFSLPMKEERKKKGESIMQKIASDYIIEELREQS